jgi:biotin/methionine sulfoxide reductase
MTARSVPTVTHWGAYQAEVTNGVITGMRGFHADPDPSPIGQSMPGARTDAVRIATPMIRQGWLKNGPRRHDNQRGAEPFVAVPWNEALDLVAGELKRVKETHGNAGIFAGSYGWASAGRFHHAQSQLRRFMNMYGGHAYSVNTYSCGAAEVIVPHVLGPFWEMTNQMSTWDVIAEHTQLIVAFGGLALKNSQVHSGGFGKHVAREAQKKLAARGVKVASIAAVRDDAADFLKAQWIAPRPNTDVALMMGLAHTLLANGWADENFLHSHCVGWDAFKPTLADKTADWASRVCGVPPEMIHQLAHDMAKHRTLITISWSLQRADHGEQTYWMAITLAAMLGQIGLPGGGVGFGYGAANGIGAGGARIAPPALPAPQNPVATFIPVARIADMLENPGAPFDYNGQHLTYPDARIVYWCGGNPFHHHQNLGRLVRAWQKPETIIVHEAWWNGQARHADIVLPVTTTLERNDIAGASSDSFALAMHKAAEPFGESRNDHDIFAGIAARLGFGPEFTDGKDERAWLEFLYGRWQDRAKAVGVAMPTLEAFWEQGYAQFPERDTSKPFLSDFRADPDAHKLNTPSGKIEIASARIASFGYDDCPGQPTWFEPAEWLGATKAKTYPLHLISNQPRTRLHSQYDNGTVSQASKVQGREAVWINPLDAAARGISSGDVVRLFNDRGACLAGALVTDAVRPNVLQLPTGAWFDPDPMPKDGANALPFCIHGNPNVLTRDAGTSKLAQGSTAQTCLVDIERWTGPVPAVRVFRAPKIVNRQSGFLVGGRSSGL